MNVMPEVLHVLDEVLGLGGRASSFTTATPLLGAIAELDSMAVVALIAGLEDRFGILVDDDDIDGAPSPASARWSSSSTARSPPEPIAPAPPS